MRRVLRRREEEVLKGVWRRVWACFLCVVVWWMIEVWMVFCVFFVAVWIWNWRKREPGTNFVELGMYLMVFPTRINSYVFPLFQLRSFSPFTSLLIPIETDTHTFFLKKFSYIIYNIHHAQQQISNPTRT